MKVQDISKEELLGLFEKLSTEVDMLPQQQRAFIRLFLSSRKYISIAKTAQVNQATVARRLKKIARQISSNNFITALSQNRNLPAKKMEVIRDYFINALPITKIAQNRNLSRHRIRKIIAELKNIKD
jgi:predicted DNA-binding protein YlxM (UPF0122 family)